MKRPISISYVGWLFIIYALLSLLPKVMLFFVPEAYETANDISESLGKNSIVNISFLFQLAHAFLGSIIMFVSGVFLLKGRNWARVALVIWMLSVLIITFAIVGAAFAFCTKLFFAVIILLLLYSRNSRNYFSSKNA